MSLSCSDEPLRTEAFDRLSLSLTSWFIVGLARLGHQHVMSLAAPQASPGTERGGPELKLRPQFNNP